MEWWKLWNTGFKKDETQSIYPVFSPRRRRYEPEAKIPLFHHSMRLTKTMAAKRTVILSEA